MAQTVFFLAAAASVMMIGVAVLFAVWQLNCTLTLMHLTMTTVAPSAPEALRATIQAMRPTLLPQAVSIPTTVLAKPAWPEIAARTKFANTRLPSGHRSGGEYRWKRYGNRTFSDGMLKAPWRRARQWLKSLGIRPPASHLVPARMAVPAIV